MKRKNAHLKREPKKRVAYFEPQPIPEQLDRRRNRLEKTLVENGFVFPDPRQFDMFQPLTREVSEHEADLAFDAARERAAFGRGGR